ncbi:hypothetical protein, partial [Rhodococcus opacus]|uniref:hypothetical protein n=1 Tax=Rhodococcus opacus TaxID=37919 RepID=UPI0013DF076A
PARPVPPIPSRRRAAEPSEPVNGSRRSNGSRRRSVEEPPVDPDDASSGRHRADDGNAVSVSELIARQNRR